MNPLSTPLTIARRVRKMVLPVIMAGLSLVSARVMAQPDYVQSVDGSIPGGNYHNVTVPSGISASVSGVVNVTGTFRVESNGTVAIADAAYISGNNFVLERDGSLLLETVLGVDGTTSGPIRTVTKDLGAGGRFTFNNVTQAQFTGPNFPDEVSELVINNPSGLGVSLSRPLRVRERLYLRNGELRTAGHKLTLVSQAPDTAQVTAASCVVFHQSGSVVGNVTAQRYINPRFNAGIGYRHYSSSVHGNTVADFSSPSNFDAVVNPQYNTVPYSQRRIAGMVVPYPNTFYYDETQVGTGGPGSYNYVFDQGYLSPTSLNDSIVVTRGYTVRIPASATVEFTGKLNNGDISTPLLTRGTLNESGWHLVGNPYPSKIDWTLLTRTGVGNAFYENRSNGLTTGVYDSYVNGIVTTGDGTDQSGANQYIAANQAFFVRVSTPGVSGQINFTNAARVTEFRNDPTAPFFRPSAPNSMSLMRLRLNSTTSSLATESVVYFQQGATTGIDPDFDAFFIDGGYPVALFSEVGPEHLSINGLPELTATTDYTVALGANIQNAGTYTINARELLNIPAGYQMMLQDAVTGTSQDLMVNPTYTFTSNGQYTNSTRFTLHVRGASVTGVSDAVSLTSFEVYPNPLKPADRLNITLPGVEQGKDVSAVLVDQVGHRVWGTTFRSALGGVREEVKTDLARGVYTLQVTLPDGAKHSRRVIVQ